MDRNSNVNCAPGSVDNPNILLVSTSDRAGGAEQMALSLLDGYAERGCRAALAVGTKATTRDDVIEIPKNAWRHFFERSDEAVARAAGARLAESDAHAFAAGRFAE